MLSVTAASSNVISTANRRIIGADLGNKVVASPDEIVDGVVKCTAMFAGQHCYYSEINWSQRKGLLWADAVLKLILEESACQTTDAAQCDAFLPLIPSIWARWWENNLQRRWE